ncbi:hypothetical protein J4Q44_G00197720 [Coregonus suidteri]|uniref:Uncharacterized protein n=1 Tax=Coregonus suidteri TaxID=861788 RepID=A0AAN8QSZ1_9TELE
MFCAHGDGLCLTLECRLGDMDIGKEASIHMEVKLNPTVLQLSPGRHGVMLMESTGIITSPREDPQTILLQQIPIAQVVLEAHFSQKPQAAVEVFIIVVSLLVGLLILTLAHLRPLGGWSSSKGSSRRRMRSVRIAGTMYPKI